MSALSSDVCCCWVSEPFSGSDKAGIWGLLMCWFESADWLAVACMMGALGSGMVCVGAPLQSAGLAVDSFTVSLHSPNSRHLPAVRAVQRDCQWPLKTMEIPTSHVSPQSILTEAILSYLDQPITKGWSPHLTSHWQPCCCQARVWSSLGWLRRGARDAGTKLTTMGVMPISVWYNLHISITSYHGENFNKKLVVNFLCKITVPIGLKYITLLLL